MTAKPPLSDPHAEIAVRRILPAEEAILWAARSRGPTWRQWFNLVLCLLAFAAFALPASPWANLGVFSTFAAFSLAWFLIGECWYVFAVTTRRVVILRTLQPRSWIFLDHSEIDENWVRSHIGSRVIKFGGQAFGVFQPSGFWSSMTSQRLGMKQYIDNVPDIEAVRGLILECIGATRPARPESRSEIQIQPPAEKRWIKTT